MSQDRVMLLIDADNLSVDVMEQAVRLLLNQHGALHVRRAYCTAESAVANQQAFKRLGIKPMVNLSTGKNSTDIAMAVDALDLVLAERPDVVVIASSDSDFAPLVQRLREKGCVVRGVGQKGKVGDETQGVYDDYTVLEHHKSAAAAEKPARKTAARKTTTRKSATPIAEVPVAPAPPAPAEKPARKRAPRKSTKAAAPAPPPVAPTLSPKAQAVIDSLPELAAGQPLALNVAVQRLREAQLLGKNTSSLKLFSQLGDAFELLPAGKPSQVRLRR